MEKKIPIREQGKPTAYIPASDIEYIEAERAYCAIYLKNKTKITLSRSMGEFLKKILPSPLLCLVHRSYAINIDEIGWYDNHHFITLKNGTHIPVSKEGKKNLLETGFIL